MSKARKVGVGLQKSESFEKPFTHAAVKVLAGSLRPARFVADIVKRPLLDKIRLISVRQARLALKKKEALYADKASEISVLDGEFCATDKELDGLVERCDLARQDRQRTGKKITWTLMD